jgi:hypothetical protein
VPDFYPFPPSRDALVYLLCTVSAKGEVTEAELDEGGFHNEEFVRAAKKLAMAVRFSPATLNGQPVEYKGARMPVRFRMGIRKGETRGVTKEFRSEALKVQKLIQDRDFAGAEHHATWMLSEKVALTLEYDVLQSTLADTYARVGQYHPAIEAVRSVTARAGMNSQAYIPGGPLPKISDNELSLPRSQLAQLLRLRFVLDDSQGFYLDALRAHADLQALGLVISEDPTMARFQSLLQIVQTTPTLKGHIKLGQKNWRHDLMFHQFTISNVAGGSIKKIWLTCGDFRRVLEFAPGLEWRIPPKYSECSAAFEGDPDTEFDIVEFRDGTQAVPVVTSH